MIMEVKTAHGEHKYVRYNLYRMALCNRLEVTLDKIKSNQNGKTLLKIYIEFKISLGKKKHLDGSNSETVSLFNVFSDDQRHRHNSQRQGFR